jgi:hypothetical protein
VPVVVAKPVVYVLRAYDLDAADTDTTVPYEFTMTAIRAEDTVTLEGFAPSNENMARKYRKAISTELRRLGVKRARWIRIRDGEPHEVSVKL